MGYGMQAFSELSAPQAPQALKTCYLSHHIVFGFSRGTWEERGEGRAGEGREGRGGEGLCTQQSIHHEVSDASSRTSSYAFTMASSSIIAMAVNMKVTVNTSEFSQIYL